MVPSAISPGGLGNVALFWSPAPVPTVTPAELARRAAAALTLPKPGIHRSPSEQNADAGVPYTWVNLWTWYWTTPASWRVISVREADGGVWAQLTVTPTSLTFTPGDGQATATCAGPGRPWTETDGAGAPSGGGCGVRYRSAHGSVTSAVSMHWRVTWRGSDGTAGALADVVTTNTSAYKVMQIQVLNR